MKQIGKEKEGEGREKKRRGKVREEGERGVGREVGGEERRIGVEIRKDFGSSLNSRELFVYYLICFIFYKMGIMLMIVLEDCCGRIK